jgi:hypothetical protein
MKVCAVIRLPITVDDPEPDTGASVASLEDAEEVKRTVYQYLRELMDNDDLGFLIERGD